MGGLTVKKDQSLSGWDIWVLVPFWPEPDIKTWPDIRPTGTGYPVHPYFWHLFQWQRCDVYTGSKMFVMWCTGTVLTIYLIDSFILSRFRTRTVSSGKPLILSLLFSVLFHTLLWLCWYSKSDLNWLRLAGYDCIAVNLPLLFARSEVNLPDEEHYCYFAELYCILY